MSPRRRPCNLPHQECWRDVEPIAGREAVGRMSKLEKSRCTFVLLKCKPRVTKRQAGIGRQRRPVHSCILNGNSGAWQHPRKQSECAQPTRKQKKCRWWRRKRARPAEASRRKTRGETKREKNKEQRPTHRRDGQIVIGHKEWHRRGRAAPYWKCTKRSRRRIWSRVDSSGRSSLMKCLSSTRSRRSCASSADIVWKLYLSLSRLLWTGAARTSERIDVDTVRERHRNTRARQRVTPPSPTRGCRVATTWPPASAVLPRAHDPPPKRWRPDHLPFGAHAVFQFALLRKGHGGRRASPPPTPPRRHAKRWGPPLGAPRRVRRRKGGRCASSWRRRGRHRRRRGRGGRRRRDRRRPQPHGRRCARRRCARRPRRRRRSRLRGRSAGAAGGRPPPPNDDGCRRRCRRRMRRRRRCRRDGGDEGPGGGGRRGRSGDAKGRRRRAAAQSPAAGVQAAAQARQRMHAVAAAAGRRRRQRRRRDGRREVAGRRCRRAWGTGKRHGGQVVRADGGGGGTLPAHSPERQVAELCQRAADAAAAVAAAPAPATVDAIAAGVDTGRRCKADKATAIAMDKVGRRRAARLRRQRRRRRQRALGRLQRRLQLPRVQVEGTCVRKEDSSAATGVDAGEATGLRRVGRWDGIHDKSAKNKNGYGWSGQAPNGACPDLTNTPRTVRFVYRSSRSQAWDDQTARRHDEHRRRQSRVQGQTTTAKDE